MQASSLQPRLGGVLKVTVPLDWVIVMRSPELGLEGYDLFVPADAFSKVWDASIAAHATPTSLNDGMLTVSAESTAWATQLRMVQAQLLAKIATAVGDGVVTSLKIVGPLAPSWRKGRYHIAGRGPRDTYG